MNASTTVDSPLARTSAKPTGAVRKRWLEAGLGLILIAAPLAFAITRGPFTDVKLVLVLAGTLAIWLARLPVNRKLATAAGIWFAVLVIASLVGVDRNNSLFGTANLDTGLILLGSCAYLLVAGASVPNDIVARLPTWIVGTSAAVAFIAIAYRFVPSSFESVIPGLSFSGSTLGYPVMFAGMMGAGLAATIGWKPKRAWMFPVVLVVLSSGMAISSKRVAWIAVALALVIGFWKQRPSRRHGMLIVATILATLFAWTVADRIWTPAEPLSGVVRFSEINRDSSAERIAIARTALQGIAARPVLGWGPSNTWSAYLSHASPQTVDRFQRGVADAHNIVLESGVTSGIVGLVALLYLAWIAFRRMRRSSPELAWACAVTTALVVYHFLQPMNVALTPMLFLVAGVAGSGLAQAKSDESGNGGLPSASGDGSESSTGGRVARIAMGIALSAGLLLSILVFASSTLEQWGRTHYDTSSLRLAAALVPGRLSSQESLAIDLSLNAAAGIPGTRAETTQLLNDAIAQHPWSPTVRLTAMDAYLIMDQPKDAVAALRAHLAVFPGDAGGMPSGMLEFARTGIAPPIGEAFQHMPTPSPSVSQAPSPLPSSPSSSPGASP